MKYRIVSKLPGKKRVTGNYWVMWSGRYGSSRIWRAAYYLHGNGWYLPGDNQLYYDTDFVKINENRIPMQHGWLISSPLFWLTVCMTILNAALLIYYLYNR